MADKNNNAYSLYNKIVIFTNYSRKYILINIPKIHCDIRIHFTDELYLLPKYMFYATYNKGNVRMKYLVELQVTISMLDMMLSQLEEYGTMNKHHIKVAVSMLNNVKNIIYGWKFNEENKKKQENI